MGLRCLLQSAAVGSAFMLAAAAVPALAADGPPPMTAHPQGVDAGGYAMPPEMQDRWLAECRDRLSGTYRRRKAESRCISYLNDYYDYYRGYQAHGGHGATMSYGYAGGYSGHTQAYGAGCCPQSVTMVPVPRPQRRAPECTETVEYEYVSVPRRAAPPPRPAPQKIVPDKRVRLK